MARPTKITPDPIIDAIVELRFESDIPPGAVFGMLFNVVRDDFSRFQKLPVAEIPEEIRQNDPNLKFTPCYQSKSREYKLNVGPNVISVGMLEGYLGWKESFYPFLQKIIKQLEKSGIIKKITRIGIRYIDFFEADIFEKITLSIKLNEQPLESEQTSISTIFKQGKFFTRVIIQNNSLVVRNKDKKIGSIIDTDTSFESDDGISFEGLEELLTEQHEVCVSVFFDLLREDFLKTLNPVY